MRIKDVLSLVACAALAAIPFIASDRAAAQAPPAATPPPQPVIAPSLPPAKVVDLMSAECVAGFNAQWKNMDAKFVEVPAMPNAGPAWKTAYDLQPHAGEMGFDDSKWQTIEAK